MVTHDLQNYSQNFFNIFKQILDQRVQYITYYYIINKNSYTPIFICTYYSILYYKYLKKF